jgi:hypothetical protein
MRRLYVRELIAAGNRRLYRCPTHEHAPPAVVECCPNTLHSAAPERPTAMSERNLPAESNGGALVGQLDRIAVGSS